MDKLSKCIRFHQIFRSSFFASSRAAIAEYFGYLGVKIDPVANSKRGEDIMISTPDSKVKVFVIPTNEELVIARDTKAICG